MKFINKIRLISKRSKDNPLKQNLSNEIKRRFTENKKWSAARAFEKESIMALWIFGTSSIYLSIMT